MEEINAANEQTNEIIKKPSFNYFPFFNRKQASFVLFVIALIFYAPSFYNEYALDDGIIIHQNEYVLKGVRGIKGILSKDLYDSFYRRMNAKDQLQGGRYRPLPVISYAIEQQFIGTYRSGYYLRNEDLNHNGKLDADAVEISGFEGKQELTYEYNNYLDKNGDSLAQSDECYYCWDLNKNFKNDIQEDLNIDGVFNEIDCHVYGAGLRHFNNIWLYALACIALYFLLSTYFFRQNPDLAFLCALLFLIHPIHSEVVANVRGRDDIFSILFISLSFIFAFRYLEKKQTGALIMSAMLFLFALLSKEYAVLLLLFIPLSFFVFEKRSLNLKQNIMPLIFFLSTASLMVIMDVYSFYFSLPDWIAFLLVSLVYVGLTIVSFRTYFIEKRTGALMIGFYISGIFYLAMRLNAVNMAPGVPDTEILNNPFLLASDTEAFATKIYTLLLDLKLMFIPHPLVSDYSYASIAYRSLSDWDFLLSFSIYILLVIIGIRLTVKRHPIGFAILFYLFFLIAVSNLIFPTGTVMLESYLFHASVGACIVLAWFLLTLADKLPGNLVRKRSILNSILILAVVFSGIKCWERSKDWKNDVTLFLKDVKNQPNSVLVLGNAGARWIDLADTKEISGILMPGEDSTRLNDYNGNLRITDQELIDSGYTSKREAALYTGIAYLKHAVELHPRYVNGFLNLGLAYFKLNKELEAIKYWKYAEHLYPNNPYLNNYYTVFSGMLKNRGLTAYNENNLSLALEEYKKWTIVNPKDPEAWHNLSLVYSKLNQENLATKYRNKATKLEQSNKDEKKSSPQTKKGC